MCKHGVNVYLCGFFRFVDSARADPMIWTSCLMMSLQFECDGEWFEGLVAEPVQGVDDGEPISALLEDLSLARSFIPADVALLAGALYAIDYMKHEELVGATRLKDRTSEFQLAVAWQLGRKTSGLGQVALPVRVGCCWQTWLRVGWYWCWKP